MRVRYYPNLKPNRRSNISVAAGYTRYSFMGEQMWLRKSFYFAKVAADVAKAAYLNDPWNRVLFSVPISSWHCRGKRRRSRPKRATEGAKTLVSRKCFGTALSKGNMVSLRQ